MPDTTKTSDEPAIPESPEAALTMKSELLAMVEREREADQKDRLWTELDRELVSAVRWIARALRGTP